MPLVVAQEAEFPIDPDCAAVTAPEMPELYFCRELRGLWVERAQGVVPERRLWPAR
jgi:hypothetical protein